MTAWTDFATEYHKNSGGKSFKASLKAAGKLWRAKGMNKSKGRKRGGDGTPEEIAAAKAAADAAAKAAADAAAKAEAEAAAKAEAEAATKAADAAADAKVVPPVVPPAMGGKSKRRKGSKKRKTRRR